MRRRLERVPIEGAADAERRAWAVVERAFGEREPRRVRRSLLVPALVAAAVLAAALAVVAVSPAGPALVRSVRQAVGIAHAERALVALPAPGRLLVDSSAGAWLVAADGSRRLLGPYAEASWSPHGLFEVVSRRRELAAVDPAGTIHWSLARSGPVRNARWSPDGYRIAYDDGRSLRVVAGDGTGDHLVAASVRPVAPAWRPGTRHVLAYVDAAGAVRIVDADTLQLLAQWHPLDAPLRLLWSPDGRRLLVAGRSSLALRSASLHAIRTLRLPRSTILDVAWAPRGGRYALAGYVAADDRTYVAVGGPRTRTVFQGTGRIDGVEWSPDGRWLVLAWRTADQWVFAPAARGGRLHAVAGITSQFHSRTFPRLAGWTR